jgi:hypothetical protein
MFENVPPAYTVLPLNRETVDGADCARIPGGSEPGDGVERGDPVAQRAADAGNTPPGTRSVLDRERVHDPVEFGFPRGSPSDRVHGGDAIADRAVEAVNEPAMYTTPLAYASEVTAAFATGATAAARRHRCRPPPGRSASDHSWW